jgi:hypothetical protein
VKHILVYADLALLGNNIIWMCRSLVLKMAAACSSETLVSTHMSIWFCNPEDQQSHFHHCEKLKSHTGYNTDLQHQTLSKSALWKPCSCKRTDIHMLKSNKCYIILTEHRQQCLHSWSGMKGNTTET